MNLAGLHQFAALPGPSAPRLAAVNAQDLTDDQRSQICNWLHWLYVPDEHAPVITESIDRRIAANRAARPGAKRIIVVTGANGVGKSTLMLEWARSTYQRQFASARLDPTRVPTYSPEPGVQSVETPIVWLNVDAGMGKPGLDAAICRFFQLPVEGTRAALADRALHALRTHRVRVVVIDDAHLLRTREKLGRELLDHLKNLNTELGDIGATMIIVGANLYGGPILSDPQIACRSQTTEIASHDAPPADEHSMIRCQRTLADTEDVLRAHVPGIARSQLSRKLAGLITTRVGSRHGDIVRLVCDAAAAHINDPASINLTAKHITTVEVPDRARDAEQAEQRNRARRQQQAASA